MYIYIIIGKIPSEEDAMRVVSPGNSTAGIIPSSDGWPEDVVNQVSVENKSGRNVQLYLFNPFRTEIYIETSMHFFKIF